MHEIIIKILEKSGGEQRHISKLIEDALTPLEGKLKIATKDKDDEGNVIYSNEIWQVGVKPVNEEHWKLKGKKVEEIADKLAKESKE